MSAAVLGKSSPCRRRITATHSRFPLSLFWSLTMSHRNALTSVVFVSLLAFLHVIMSYAQDPKGEPKTATRNPDTVSGATAPDLVISSLTARFIKPDKVEYEWSITNVGTADANLDGPTKSEADNVSIQAFVSKDPVFQNDDDKPAGGTILGLSPLGKLAPGESKKGQFTATIKVATRDYPYLVMMADWGKVVAEQSETNNFAAVGIGLRNEAEKTATGKATR